MKRRPILTIVIISILVFMNACAPKTIGPQPVPTQPAQQATQASENPIQPTVPATELPPTQTPTEEPLPDLHLYAPQGSAKDAAARLAGGLAASTTGMEAYPLVVELLAWSGIPVYDSDTGALLMPVMEPAAEVSYFDFEAYGFTLDYLNGSGLFLSEVAEALTEAETTLNDAPMSVDFLEDLLARWVAAASELDPQSWEAFTPFYLAESALRKPHAIDLSYPGYDGESLHYSHLEWLLFFAAQTRTGREVPPSVVAIGNGGAFAAPARLDMCTVYQKALSKLGEFLAGEVNSQTGDALGGAIEDSAEQWSGTAGKVGKWAGKGLGWMMALLSVVASSTAWSIEVRGDPDPSHYKHNEANDKYAYFIARVKLDEKWPEWLGSCMKSMGMDVPSQDAIKDAKIRWRGLHGFNTHATIDSEGLNGQLESRFNAAGEAKMKVKLSREKNGDWENAPQKDDYLKVKVELLFDAKFPGPSTWIAAAKGGPIGASIPTLTQWYQRWFPEKAYGIMKIQYHKIVPMIFERKTTANGIETVFKGYNCEGLYGDWVMTASMTGTTSGLAIEGMGVYTGQIARGETGAFEGSMNIDFDLVNSQIPINGSIDINSNGELSITGTEQSPVLQMRAKASQGSGAGQSPVEQIQMPFSGPGGSPIGFLLKESPDDPRCSYD